MRDSLYYEYLYSFVFLFCYFTSGASDKYYNNSIFHLTDQICKKKTNSSVVTFHGAHEACVHASKHTTWRLHTRSGAELYVSLTLIYVPYQTPSEGMLEKAPYLIVSLF